MRLHSNFCYVEHIFKSLEFAIRNFYVFFFFLLFWPKNALANSDFRTFTVTNGKKNEDKYLIFTLIVVEYF